jgi:hypothetical protein
MTEEYTDRQELLDKIRRQIEDLLFSDEVTEEEKLARIWAAQAILDEFERSER